MLEVAVRTQTLIARQRLQRIFDLSKVLIMPRLKWNLIGRANVWRASLRLEAAIENVSRKNRHGKSPAPHAEGKEQPAKGQPAKAQPAGKGTGQRSQAETPPWIVDTFMDRSEMFRSILASRKPGKLVDLGTGHGSFAQQAQELGWQVTAVDARSERFPGTPGIEWVVSDVREFEFGPGDYDCVCVLGLFYHLGLPAQLELLRKCAGTFTLIDTHVALSREVTKRGYDGKYYVEAGKNKTDEELRAALSSSWGNRQSFWPTEESLLKMLRDTGFSFVAPVRPCWQKDRTLYLCYP